MVVMRIDGITWRESGKMPLDLHRNLTGISISTPRYQEWTFRIDFADTFKAFVGDHDEGGEALLKQVEEFLTNRNVPKEFHYLFTVTLGIINVEEGLFWYDSGHKYRFDLESGKRV